MTRLKTVFLTLLAAPLCVAGLATAAPKYEKPTNDILADGLDDLLKPAAPKPKDSKQPAGKQQPYWAPQEQMLNDLIRDGIQGGDGAPRLGEDLGEPQEPPLLKVEKSMGKATRLIGRLDQSGKTVAVQQQIVTDLDALIKQMEKQCQGGQCDQPSASSSRQQSQRSKPKQAAGKPAQGKPSASRSSNAAQESTARLDRADPTTVKGRLNEELMKEVWGHLPERIREQMLQSTTDEFLPQYREEIERYFQRLAEEEAARNSQP